MIRALIVDLDDTIFPTKSIESNLVQIFFDRLKEVNDVLSEEEIGLAIEMMYQQSFKKVSDQFGFSENMIKESLKALDRVNLKQSSIKVYPDYHHLADLNVAKHLVTTGIRNFQLKKIKALNINDDFKSILVDDPMENEGGKLRLFKQIMEEESYLPDEILVIGDNEENEIKAGDALGLHCLTIKRKATDGEPSSRMINSFSNLASIVNKLNRQKKIDRRNQLQHQPFSYNISKDQKVFIFRNHRQIKIIKGKEALEFINYSKSNSVLNIQLKLAKITGHYKHGD